MNARGKVPVLKDGDYVVYESIAVLHYLDAKYPAVPFFGSTPEERGTITRLMAECDAYLQPAVLTFARNVFGGQVKGHESDVREAAQTIRTELANAETALAKTPWLAGKTISAADIALFPFVQIVQRAAGKPDAAALDLGLVPIRDRFPAIAAWLARVEALPGYERTYPPHWRAS
jgi:glutathione S-transferase